MYGYERARAPLAFAHTYFVCVGVSVGVVIGESDGCYGDGVITFGVVGHWEGVMGVV